MEFILGLALSAHIGFDRGYNNIHPFFDIRHENLIIGGYYNSLETTSFYFGRSNELFKGLSIETVIVSGYNASIIPTTRLVFDNYYVLIGKEGKDYGLVIGYQIPLNTYVGE